MEKMPSLLPIKEHHFGADSMSMFRNWDCRIFKRAMTLAEKHYDT